MELFEEKLFNNFKLLLNSPNIENIENIDKLENFFVNIKKNDKMPNWMNFLKNESIIYL